MGRDLGGAPLAPPPAADLNSKSNQTLDSASLRRLLVSLILDVQRALTAQGAIDTEQCILHKSGSRTAAEIDLIRIDEPSVGLDSLARLELIMKVNQFFALHLTGVEDYLLLRPTIGDWVSLLAQHFQLAQADLPITFSTSGSTGAPANVSHSISVLLTEVNALKDVAFPTWPNHGRIFSLVPPHHIFGFLFTCLLPTQYQREVVDYSRQNLFSVFAQAQEGDVVIATPYLWKLLVETGRKFAKGVQGVTSGGPSDETVWQAKSQSKLTHLTEIYGATETAGIGMRTSHRAPFRVLPHLYVKSKQVWRHQSEAPLAIQDELAWVSDCAFEVIGRLDKVVQVAGVNVSPSFIAKQIEASPLVSAAAVRLDRDRLKAFVVLRDPEEDKKSARATIFTDVLKELPAIARPTTITFGRSLQINAEGKAADWTPIL